MSIVDGHGHENRGLIAGIAEHQPLIPSALFFKKTFTCGDSLRDVRRLFVYGGHHRTGLPVKSHFRVVVANFLDGISDDLRHVHPTGGGDLAGNYRHSGGHQGLAGHPTLLVFSHNSVQDRIRNTIGNLVWMSFGDRFRSEQISSCSH